MKSFLRMMYAWGIVGVIVCILTPDSPLWATAIGGFLIGLGSGGWNDR